MAFVDGPLLSRLLCGDVLALSQAADGWVGQPMMISDEIRAKVDEAERRLGAASIAPWQSVHTHPAGEIGRIETTIPDQYDNIVALANGVWVKDADLIVSVVNRERAQIEHARDVLERHVRIDDANYNECHGCDDLWPCPEILSVGRAWGVQA